MRGGGGYRREGRREWHEKKGERRDPDRVISETLEDRAVAARENGIIDIVGREKGCTRGAHMNRASIESTVRTWPKRKKPHINREGKKN